MARSSLRGFAGNTCDGGPQLCRQWHAAAGGRHKLHAHVLHLQPGMVLQSLLFLQVVLHIFTNSSNTIDCSTACSCGCNSLSAIAQSSSQLTSLAASPVLLSMARVVRHMTC